MLKKIILVVITIVALILNPIIKAKKIENLKSFSFIYSTGYYKDASVIYELKYNDKWILYYKGDGISDEDTISYEVDENLIERLENILNKYEVSRWNGFNKNDKYVLDGNSFSISINYNENNSVSAHGYESWPTNYHNVKNELNNLFNEYIKEK